jgi:hypothetical protein
VKIDIAAIAGVTAPATGATPVTAVTETAQYTGTVAWNGNPAAFAAATAYTATITLTAKAGYTLQGVAENFFTVAGATTVTNPANSGVVQTVFPATAAAAGTLKIVNNRTNASNTVYQVSMVYPGAYDTVLWNQSDLSITYNGGSQTFTGVPEGAYTAVVEIRNFPNSPLLAFNTRIEKDKTTTVTVPDGPVSECNAGDPQ